jgi:cyclase
VGTIQAELIKVGTSAYAYIQDDGSWWINNAGFIVGSSGVVLIDTCSTEARTRALHDAIRSVTEAPIRTVVNTHHHGDHTYGNSVFAPATIVGHAHCFTEAARTGIKRYEETFEQPDWGNLQLTTPNLTFESRLNLHADETLIELHHMGGPAHTSGDVVAWLPTDRVLYTGDLVFHGGTPFILMGSVAGSLRSLDWMRSFNPTTLVPGHGVVCGPEAFDVIERYLLMIQRVSGEAIEAGLTPLEAALKVDLGEFVALNDSERLVGNLHRGMAELLGVSVDESSLRREAIADMVRMRGGALLPCSA